MTIGALVMGLLVVAAAWAAPAAPSDSYADADAVYAALRTSPHTRLSLGGSQIDVVFADGAAGLNRDPVLGWIRMSAQAVTTYFGSFPVGHVGILVSTDEGARISSGATYGFGEPAIRIAVGRAANEAVFKDDWVLVHEMTHLALPTVPRRSEWLLEGNATYVEPIARAQAGQLDPAVVWRWALEGMPKGLPQPGDQGLDHTPTWGRTYWGGALFWLLADIRIRQRTQDRLGVQDALRAINRQSGGIVARWSVDKVVAAGDQATGTEVLTSLYAQMKATAAPIDLENLFAELGVALREGKVVFDDHAPLAEIRRRITAPPADAKTAARGAP